MSNPVPNDAMVLTDGAYERLVRERDEAVKERDSLRDNVLPGYVAALERVARERDEARGAFGNPRPDGSESHA